MIPGCFLCTWAISLIRFQASSLLFLTKKPSEKETNCIVEKRRGMCSMQSKEQMSETRSADYPMVTLTWAELGGCLGWIQYLLRPEGPLCPPQGIPPTSCLILWSRICLPGHLFLQSTWRRMPLHTYTQESDSLGVNPALLSTSSETLGKWRHPHSPMGKWRW